MLLGIFRLEQQNKAHKSLKLNTLTNIRLNLIFVIFTISYHDLKAQYLEQRLKQI